eukprot:5480347-Alexandrium_andersonii.AAC.1
MDPDRPAGPSAAEGPVGEVPSEQRVFQPTTVLAADGASGFPAFPVSDQCSAISCGDSCIAEVGGPTIWLHESFGVDSSLQP